MASKRLILNSVVLCGWLGGLSPAVTLAELEPDWVVHHASGASISAGLYGMAVDVDGNSYVTGITGPSFNRDITTTKFDAFGDSVWSVVYDGPAEWHEGAAGIALGADGSVYVAGSTPGAGSYADVLLLKYDQTSGALVWDQQYDGGPFSSDGATCITTDGAGNVYVGGHTLGDGSDCLTVKFDADGNVLWSQTWDGPASAPYSQEAVRGIKVDHHGDVIIITDGVMNTLHSDYVTIKYDGDDGSMRWQHNFGSFGGDAPTDVAIDDIGDVYVTGISLDFTNKYATVKIRGADAAQLWAEYDSNGLDDGAIAIYLDGAGGVYITGAVDPDGNQSNFNENIYTVKRDADTGGQLWTHLYGANCVGCYDVPADLLLDAAGHVFVAGSTSSPPYSGDMILLALDPTSGVEVDRGIIAGDSPEHAGAGVLQLDSYDNLYIGGEVYNANTGAVDISVVKYASMGLTLGDLDDDGTVGAGDLGMLLGAWGPCAGCAADYDDDGFVGSADLALLLGNWG